MTDNPSSDWPVPADSKFQVRKYPLPVPTRAPTNFTLTLPVNREFCLFDRDGEDRLCVWFAVQVAAGARTEPVEFLFRGTGQPMTDPNHPDERFSVWHVASLVDRYATRDFAGAYVWHLFSKQPPTCGECECDEESGLVDYGPDEDGGLNGPGEDDGGDESGPMSGSGG